MSLVARRHGIAGNQLFTWRRLMAQGALTAATAGEEVVPASDYRAMEAQVRELQRLLGKKTMENELLREAVSRAAAQKNGCCARPPGRRVDRESGCRCRRCITPTSVRDATAGRTAPSWAPALPDAETLADIRRLIADLPTYDLKRPGAPAPRSGRKRARSAQSKTYLPPHEAAWPATPTSFWSRCGTEA